MIVACLSRGFEPRGNRSVGMAESNRTDWRQICAAAAMETDSEKLADLVHQLIKALDERGDAFASPTQLDQWGQS
jgi:hypothetical protein